MEVGVSEAAVHLYGQRVARGFVRLERGDDVLTAALGPGLAESYLAVRRSEWSTYSLQGADFEHRGHFLKY